MYFLFLFICSHICSENNQISSNEISKMNTKEASNTAAKQEGMNGGDSTCISSNGGSCALDQTGGANVLQQPQVTSNDSNKNTTGTQPAPATSTQSGYFNPFEAALPLLNNIPAVNGLRVASDISNKLIEQATQKSNSTGNSTDPSQQNPIPTANIQNGNQQEQPNLTTTA